jgi:predicted N-acetyltransferase YhbS
VRRGGADKVLGLGILATHPGYRKLGFASQLIQWGCDEADKAGLECFLNASKLGKPLYEKHGYIEQVEAKDPVVPSAAMLRPARKVDEQK